MIYLPLEKPKRGSDHLFIEDYEIAEEPSNDVKLQATRILAHWLVERWTKKSQSEQNASTLPDRGVFYTSAKRRKTPQSLKGA